MNKNNILNTCLRELILEDEIKFIQVSSDMKNEAYKNFLNIIDLSNRLFDLFLIEFDLYELF